jgi:hypothetical protein
MRASELSTKRSGAIVPLACCLVFAAAAATAADSPSDRAADEAQITACEREWSASFTSGDTAGIERCVADDFVGVNGEGKLYDKASLLATTRKEPRDFASDQLGEMKVRFFGDAAVAQGEESWRRRTGERGRFVWTDTWIRRQGKWQLVAAEGLIAPEAR